MRAHPDGGKLAKRSDYGNDSVRTVTPTIP